MKPSYLCFPGLGEKANDSLDMMFDTTAYGEYKSYNSSHLGQSQPCDEDDDDGDDEREEEDAGRHLGFDHGIGVLCSASDVSSQISFVYFLVLLLQIRTRSS